MAANSSPGTTTEALTHVVWTSLWWQPARLLARQPKLSRSVCARHCFCNCRQRWESRAYATEILLSFSYRCSFADVRLLLLNCCCSATAVGDDVLLSHCCCTAPVQLLHYYYTAAALLPTYELLLHCCCSAGPLGLCQQKVKGSPRLYVGD